MRNDYKILKKVFEELNECRNSDEISNRLVAEGNLYAIVNNFLENNARVSRIREIVGRDSITDDLLKLAEIIRFESF